MKKSPAKKPSPSLAAMKAKKREEMKRNQAGGQQVQVEMPADPFQSTLDAKEVTRGATGLAYDAKMLLHENPWDPDHIECPERLRRAEERCRELGLTERCAKIEVREATEEEILTNHTQAHLDRLKELVQKDTEEIKSVCLQEFHSVYMNASSFEAAKLAVGATLEATDAVLEGRVQNALALVRPPGHHAMKAEFCGFCLLNNVAIATRRALKHPKVKKVLIIDFDVHHGQATQQAFYDDPNVLYVSLHRFEYGAFWPHLRESDYDFTGQGKGKGFNVNVPLNKIGMADQDYLAAFHQLILPLSYEFSPDFILVSAGFDAAIGCPEGEMSLSPQVYGHIVSSLMALAGGKVAVVMEGGYFIESLAEGAAMTLRALLGDVSMPLGALPEPSDSMVDTILNGISALREFWQFLRVQEEYSISEYDATVDENCHEPTLHYEKEHLLADVGQSPEATYYPGAHYMKHSEEAVKSFMSILSQMKGKYLHILTRPEISKKVALVYDKAMARHCNMEEPGHPERPHRVLEMIKRHEEYGLLSRDTLMRIDPRRATKEEILLCHDEKHYDDMADTPSKTQKELEDMADKLDSVYLNPTSFDCALLACGSLLNVVDAVCHGDSEKGVAIIRPPGHHAESDEACGFCIFNNVPVAAKYALETHGLKRVLILDWDVHHGNGIQNMFYDDPRVLYISLHRYDHGTFFPSRPDANYDFVGEGKGKGYNINVPWNGSGMGDPEYTLALFNVILPVAYQFDPELVLVSAGFDAARGDPLGHCKVSPQMYGHFLSHLKGLAAGKVIVALEGGYNLNSISLSMAMCTKALLGDPMPPVEIRQPKQSAIASIQDVIRAHSEHWSCLKFGAKLPDSFEDLKVQLYKSPKASPKKTLPDKKEDSYIPSEFGQQHSSSNVVYTYTSSSDSRRVKDERVVDSPKPKGSEKPFAAGGDGDDADALAASMGAVTLAGGGGNHSDYVPSEYGPNFSSPFVNTYSNSFKPATYTVTESATKKKENESK